MSNYQRFLFKELLTLILNEFLITGINANKSLHKNHKFSPKIAKKNSDSHALIVVIL